MRVLIEGLSFPSALADAGDDAVYVAESNAGRLLQIDTATGASTMRRIPPRPGARNLC